MYSSVARSTARAVRAVVLFVAGVVAGVLYLPRVATLPVPAAQAEPRPAPQQPPSARDVAARALASTVFLHGGSVYGAGVVLDRAGHVLTCDHVIDGLDHIDASFDGDAKAIPVRVVARAGDVDLALLELVGGLPAGRAPLATASVTSVAMGDAVYAMGSPRKMRFSLSHGIVSYVGREFDGTYYVQTDLSANGGSSGGPVMNERGEVVGVSSFIFHDSEGLTFAVPIDYAWEKFGAALGRSARDGRRFREWLDARARVAPSKT